MLVDKNIILTGATSGIGLETCKLLLFEGANVIGMGSSKLSCRKAHQKCFDLSNNIKFIECDLSDQASIHNAAAIIKAMYNKIDALINNAGVIYLKPITDKLGIEKTFSVNYLGHYLLTRLLFPYILNSTKPSIVNVSSMAYKTGVLDLAQLGNNEITGMKAYSRSKLAQILFTQTLAQKLSDSNVSVNCLHPGLIGTNLLSKNGVLGSILTVAHKIVGRSVAHGAKNVLHNVNLEKAGKTNGQYYVNSKIEPLLPHAKDPKKAIRLWDLSANLCNLPLNDN